MKLTDEAISIMHYQGKRDPAFARERDPKAFAFMR
jgi:hypothetical protein